jgi:hypothetical protein
LILVEVLQAAADCAPRRPRRLRARDDPAIASRSDVYGGEQPTGPLVQASADGRKPFANDLGRLLEPATKGDPMRPLRWVSKSHAKPDGRKRSL